MAESKGNAASGGIGFFSLLGIVFIALKLTGVIQWSWWLVLLPIYGPFVAGLLVFFAVLFVVWLALGSKGVGDVLRGL